MQKGYSVVHPIPPSYQTFLFKISASGSFPALCISQFQALSPPGNHRAFDENVCPGAGH